MDRSFCPIMKAISEIGDRWILLILRESFLGVRRFDDYHTNLKVSKSVLSTKLSRMIELKLLEKRTYKEENERSRQEYRLTQKGIELYKIIIALLEWGNSHLVKEGEPSIFVVDREEKKEVEVVIEDSSGRPLNWRGLELIAREKR